MAAAAVLRSEVYQSLFPTEHYNVFVNKGLRPDGRALAEARRAAAQVGVVAAAAASASVQIGGTLVIAGATLELAVPDDASPDSGRLQTQVEITNLANPSGNFADATHRAAALTHTTAAVFQNAAVADVGQLSIVSGKHCWDVHLRLYVLNDDGCLLDACVSVASKTLASLQVPEMDVAPDTQELQARVADGVEQHKPFALQCRPLAATVGLYNGHVIVDPTAQEEGIMGSAVTVIADEEGRLHGVHAVGDTEMSSELIPQVAKLANARRQQLL